MEAEIRGFLSRRGPQRLLVRSEMGGHLSLVTRGRAQGSLCSQSIHRDQGHCAPGLFPLLVWVTLTRPRTGSVKA